MIFGVLCFLFMIMRENIQIVVVKYEYVLPLRACRSIGSRVAGVNMVRGLEKLFFITQYTWYRDFLNIVLIIVRVVHQCIILKCNLHCILSPTQLADLLLLTAPQQSSWICQITEMPLLFEYAQDQFRVFGPCALSLKVANIQSFCNEGFLLFKTFYAVLIVWGGSIEFWCSSEQFWGN